LNKLIFLFYCIASSDSFAFGDAHAPENPRAIPRIACVAEVYFGCQNPPMQHAIDLFADPHDDPFEGAPPDLEFANERAWIEAGKMRAGQPTAVSVPSDPDAAIAEPRFLIDWVDQHRESRYPPDPSFRNGVAIDVALDAAQACRVQLAYPAERCGIWVITCRVCGYSVALGTAGRADDPVSVRVPCRERSNEVPS
jgi:hypothetical protein